MKEGSNWAISESSGGGFVLSSGMSMTWLRYWDDGDEQVYSI